MWRTMSLILIAMWVLRTLSSYTMNGFIQILLVITIVTLLLRLISGRQVVDPGAVRLRDFN
jgi:Family of unknown function (DUF5670)